MKTAQLATVLGLGAIMAFSNPASAQTGGNNGAVGAGNTATTGANDQRDDNNETDYGWIGLLGLAGLAGLLKRPERHVVHQTDTQRNNTKR